MTKKNAPAKPRTSQDAPTQPQPRDANGRLLDQWGLPISGPARAARLAELGIADPAIEPSLPGPDVGGDQSGAAKIDADDNGAGDTNDQQEGLTNG